MKKRFENMCNIQYLWISHICKGVESGCLLTILFFIILHLLLLFVFCVGFSFWWFYLQRCSHCVGFFSWLSLLNFVSVYKDLSMLLCIYHICHFLQQNNISLQSYATIYLAISKLMGIYFFSLQFFTITKKCCYKYSGVYWDVLINNLFEGQA